MEKAAPLGRLKPKPRKESYTLCSFCSRSRNSRAERGAKPCAPRTRTRCGTHVPIGGVAVDVAEHVGVGHIPVDVQRLVGEQEKALPHQGPGHGLGKAQGAPLGRGAVPVVVAQHQHLFPGQLGEDGRSSSSPRAEKSPRWNTVSPAPTFSFQRRMSSRSISSTVAKGRFS